MGLTKTLSENLVGKGHTIVLIKQNNVGWKRFKNIVKTLAFGRDHLPCA